MSIFSVHPYIPAPKNGEKTNTHLSGGMELCCQVLIYEGFRSSETECSFLSSLCSLYQFLSATMQEESSQEMNTSFLLHLLRRISDFRSQLPSEGGFAAKDFQGGRRIRRRFAAVGHFSWNQFLNMMIGLCVESLRFFPQILSECTGVCRGIWLKILKLSAGIFPCC